MPKARGRSHTTLTETAAEVVAVLKRLPSVKMIAPGHITNTGRRGAAEKFLTVIYTNAGVELLITGQGTQKVAIHTDNDPKTILHFLTNHKKLKDFTIKTRTRKPGV